MTKIKKMLTLQKYRVLGTLIYGPNLIASKKDKRVKE